MSTNVELLDSLNAQIDRMRADMELLQQDLIGKNREISSLKAEATKQKRDKPEYAQAKELFEYWKAKLGKRASTVYGEGREKALLAMLKHFSVEDLKKAIDGCALKPYVGPHGRVSTTGKGAKRQDEIKLIVRDETYVERFMGYVDEAQEASQEATERLKGQITEIRAHDYGRRFDGAPRDYNCFPKLIRALEDHGCTVRGAGARYSSQCPAHEDRDPSLSIREKDDGKILIHCHAGCETVDVLSAIGLDFVHLMGVEAA